MSAPILNLPELPDGYCWAVSNPDHVTGEIRVGISEAKAGMPLRALVWTAVTLDEIEDMQRIVSAAHRRFVKLREAEQTRDAIIAQIRAGMPKDEHGRNVYGLHVAGEGLAPGDDDWR